MFGASPARHPPDSSKGLRLRRYGKLVRHGGAEEGVCGDGLTMSPPFNSPTLWGLTTSVARGVPGGPQAGWGRRLPSPTRRQAFNLSCVQGGTPPPVGWPPPVEKRLEGGFIYEESRKEELVEPPLCALRGHSGLRGLSF